MINSDRVVFKEKERGWGGGRWRFESSVGLKQINRIFKVRVLWRFERIIFDLYSV